MNFDPDDNQLPTLGGLDPETPVAALNLFQSNERSWRASSRGSGLRSK